jgi:hypothetical protein
MAPTRIIATARRAARSVALALALACCLTARPAGADVLAFHYLDGFGLLDGYGNDACTGNVPQPAHYVAPVHLNRAVGCTWGSGSVDGSAGRGALVAAASHNHEGFGTGGGLGIDVEFHGPLFLASAANATIPVSLNLIVSGNLSQTTETVYKVVLLSQVRNGPTFFAAQMTDGSGSGIPSLDGAPHLLTTSTVLLDTNTPYEFGVLLGSNAGGYGFDSHISVQNTVTFPESGPVFNLPPGVDVDVPELNVFDNHWTNPNVAVGGTPAFEFGLMSLRPNPSRPGRLAIDFVLPSSERASLDLFDLAGRRVHSRDLGALGAGAHSVNLTHEIALEPGVYLVRLTQGNRAAVRRAVVVGD